MLGELDACQIVACFDGCPGASCHSLTSPRPRIVCSLAYYLPSTGEVACTGLHGANRLASTSLLEGLVWGCSVADHLADRSKVDSKDGLAASADMGALVPPNVPGTGDPVASAKVLSSAWGDLRCVLEYPLTTTHICCAVQRNCFVLRCGLGRCIPAFRISLCEPNKNCARERKSVLPTNVTPVSAPSCWSELRLHLNGAHRSCLPWQDNPLGRRWGRPEDLLSSGGRPATLRAGRALQPPVRHVRALPGDG